MQQPVVVSLDVFSWICPFCRSAPHEVDRRREFPNSPESRSARHYGLPLVVGALTSCTAHESVKSLGDCGSDWSTLVSGTRPARPTLKCGVLCRLPWMTGQVTSAQTWRACAPEPRRMFSG